MTFLQFLELPDNTITNIISFLNIKEAVQILFLSKQLISLNTWNALAKAYNLDLEKSEYINTGQHLYYAWCKSRYIPESELQIAWGDDERYWKRGVLIKETAYTTKSFVKTCASLHLVWWLHISGIYRAISSGPHNVFMRVGSKYDGLNMGFLNRIVSVIDASIPNSDLVPIDTSKCVGSLSGWYWLHLGTILVPSAGTNIKFEAYDTGGSQKGPVLISHVEIIPTSSITDEQEDAINNGWAFSAFKGVP